MGQLNFFFALENVPYQLPAHDIPVNSNSNILIIESINCNMYLSNTCYGFTIGLNNMKGQDTVKL